ncbi:MAG TPA: BON domain-containing protein [Acidobacteriaceae bacterium]
MGVPMKTAFGIVVLAGGLALSAAAQQKPLPDAQVESNVLRALASAPELSTQNIQSTTVYGVVTLTGSANDEGSRTKAENLVARAQGVKKVVDEMTIGAVDAQAGPPPDGADQAPLPPDNAQQAADQPAQPGNNDGMVLQSDGTYAPATPQDQTPSPPSQQANDNGYPAPPPPAGANREQYPPRRAMYGNGAPPPPAYGGQVGGQQVTIPNGAMVRIRINEGLSTHRTTPGSVFDGTVLNDVVADGAVAIPRGAAVQGTVIQAKDSGSLKGRGELALQLTTLTMGGKTYTLTSDTWTREGQDKTAHTVNSAIGLGALGALFGAVAGGGAGAAIGAGVGGAAGVASSAASPNGRVVIPPEAVLTFHLAQPTTVSTVSEAEMQRLSYAAGPNPARPVVRRYPPNYYAPGPY